MTPDTLAAFCLGITVGVWLTCIVGMAIYAIAGREDVPVVTGAHSGDDDEDEELDSEGYLRASASTYDFWNNELDAEYENWLNDSVFMQRGRVDE